MNRNAAKMSPLLIENISLIFKGIIVAAAIKVTELEALRYIVSNVEVAAVFPNGYSNLPINNFIILN